MPRYPHKAHLYELAKRGAEAQFRDLVMEARLLVKMFPCLRDSFGPENSDLVHRGEGFKAPGASADGCGRTKSGERPRTTGRPNASRSAEKG
jgi:hypothetical protein